ncbi:hypothetical protein IAT38_001351 [Cryptococcus sp. DSM 104549]
MRSPLSLPLGPIISLFPERHPANQWDYALGFANIFFTALVLTLPATGGWRFFRIAVAAPAICYVWAHLAYSTITENNYDHWGIPVLFMSFCFKTCELLVFFPAEEHVHRLIPSTARPSASGGHALSNGNGVANGKTDTSLKPPTSPQTLSSPVLVPEPVPAPFTLAKFYWASSLFWSYRGVGWNYCCPMPASSRQAPYTRGSSRSAFFISQLRFMALAWLFNDALRTFIRYSPSREFLLGPGSIPYAQLTLGERAVYSVSVVTRVWYGMNLAQVTVALACVGLGGVMGWEGEIWSPWGWPPLFGNFVELWRLPGLSTMWSKTWQGYNRRWLYVFGWIGIGENILGLTHTGISAHPSVPPSTPSATSSGANTPLTYSGRVSPNHPIPTNAPQLPSRRMSPRLMAENLIKSLAVFTLSGLQHDCGTLALLLKTRPEKALVLGDVLLLTPFFVMQPLALAAEAGVKTAWRGWKFAAHPEWRRGAGGKGGGEPGWLVFIERLVGFVWTWVWLGWSAMWFVDGLAGSGAYWPQKGDAAASLVGGLWKGQWFY